MPAETEAVEASWARERRISETVMSTVPREIAPSEALMTVNAIAAMRPAA